MLGSVRLERVNAAKTAQTSPSISSFKRFRTGRKRVIIPRSNRTERNRFVSDANDSAAEFDAMKVTELRKLLKQRGLQVSGKKIDLIERLRARSKEDCADAVEDAMTTKKDVNTTNTATAITATTINNTINNNHKQTTTSTVMQVRTTSASFASEDLRKELDRAKDREDGKNYTGLEITWLGTSSGAPTFSRNVSATALRTQDEVWLFDCGEATQHQMMRSGVKLSKITRIFITHMHGDHIFGLPGLLCAISASRSETYKQTDQDRKKKSRKQLKSDDSNIKNGPRDAFKEPLVITGPPGLKAFVHAAMTYSRTQLGTDIVVTELVTPSRNKYEKFGGKVPEHVAVNESCAWKKRGNLVFGDLWPQEGLNHIGFPKYKAKEWEEENQHTWPSWVVFSDNNVCVRAAPLNHPVPCFGYVVEEKDRDGHMKVDWLTEQGLPPSRIYKDFKNGKSIESPKEPGRMITAEEAMEPPRPGRKIVLLGDTCGSEGIAKWAYGADVLIHESTFNAERTKEAKFKGHSTSAMAGEFAKRVNARTLVLTHFSARYASGFAAFSSSSSTRSSSNSKYEEDRYDGSSGSNNNTNNDHNNNTNNKSKNNKDDENDDDDEEEEDNEAPPDKPPSDEDIVQEKMHVGTLVNEAAKAKGDTRVLAASDLFTLAIYSREEHDEIDKMRESYFGSRNSWFSLRNNEYVLPKMRFPGRI